MSLLWTQAVGTEVHEMPHHEFVQKYRPGLWAHSWEHVEAHPDFDGAGDNGWHVHDLANDMAERGHMHTPVEVEGDEVTDGHHRVIAAGHAGVPVRYYDNTGGYS